MRPLEVLFVVFVGLAAICLLSGRWLRASRWLTVGALAVAIGHWVLEGWHWQMIPAYVAVAILGLTALRRNGRGFVPIFAGWSAVLLVAASLLFCWMLPIFHLPKPTGPYAVGTRILYLKDASRKEDAVAGGGSARELMVQLWYPARPSSNLLARYRESRETQLSSSYQTLVKTNSRLDAPIAGDGAPFPVILFNHGWHGRRTNDTFLTEDLASHGYVVASIDHTYNASLVAFPDGRVARTTAASDVDFPDLSTQERVKAAWSRELAKQTADQEFVLDRLAAMNREAGGDWFGRLDTDKTGAIGHSFGGAAATEFCAKDSRVRGAVNLDGWFFEAIQVRGANQPLLYIDTATADPASFLLPTKSVSAALDVSDFADLKTSMSKFGGYRVSVNGAAHQDFTDQPLVSPLRLLSHRGALPADELEKVARAYVLAFFDRTIRGKDSALLHAGSTPYAGVTLEVWPAATKREAVPQTDMRGR